MWGEGKAEIEGRIDIDFKIKLWTRNKKYEPKVSKIAWHHLVQVGIPNWVKWEVRCTKFQVHGDGVEAVRGTGEGEKASVLYGEFGSPLGNKGNRIFEPQRDPENRLKPLIFHYYMLVLTYVADLCILIITCSFSARSTPSLSISAISICHFPPSHPHTPFAAFPRRRLLRPPGICECTRWMIRVCRIIHTAELTLWWARQQRLFFLSSFWIRSFWSRCSSD